MNHLVVVRFGLAVLGLAAVSVIAPTSAKSEQQPAPSAESSSGAGVTFAGFQQLTKEQHRVFVRLTALPELEVSSEGKVLTFSFADTRILLKNNRNPLDLTHFKTPLVRARLKQVDGVVRLVMNFRKKVESRHRFLKRSDGSVTFQVDFEGH